MHILKDFITIDDLETRWGLDKNQIESFTYGRVDDEPRLTMWYATEVRPRPDGGQSAFVKPAQDLNGCIFDMADVLEIEELNPELVRKETDQGDSELKMIGDKFIFTERQLIKKEDLYKRWFGATDEEIVKHFDTGELRAYEHYKGPINGVVWCIPGQIYYQDRHDYSNPGVYEYRDNHCSYFLLTDVVRCETEHPEYTGNVTPESLGLVQDGASGAPEEEPEYVKAESLRKEMKLSPVQFVDYLRDNQDLVFFGNGVNDGSRNWFYRTASREQASGMLDDMYIHRLDITAHEKRIAGTTSIPPFPVAGSSAAPMADIPFPTVEVDTSGLESQLAEAQKKIEDVEGVRRWNKQFLTERAELQSSLEEKDARIAELEKELAAVKAVLENGKSLADAVCRMRREGKTDEAIAAYLHDDGKWCSQAQVGALLHADGTRVAADSMNQRARRLLGKA